MEVYVSNHLHQHNYNWLYCFLLNIACRELQTYHLVHLLVSTKIYLNKILDLIKKANQDDIIELPENLSGINVDIPPSKYNCDMSTNVAMVLSKPNKKSPIELAEIIANIIKSDDENIDDVLYYALEDAKAVA